LKILIYTHEFPPFAGGAGIYSYDLAMGLASQGVQVHIASAISEKPPKEFPLSVQGNQVFLHHLERWKTINPLIRLHMRYRFDLVIVTEGGAQEAIATLDRQYFRYAAIIHGTEVLDYFSGKGTQRALEPLRMARFFEQAELCIAVSDATLQLARRLLAGTIVNLEMVQNGINLGRLPEPIHEEVQRLRHSYGEDTEIVFCLGRLDLDKGQDILMAAFEKVHRIRPKARLLLGGIGPLEASLKQLRESLALRDCVEFLGKLSQKSLPSYFALCDIFALTSKSENRWEGFGLVYLEANYYERPALGGNEGGVPEAIVNNETGLVVNPRDTDAIASAIVSLLADKSLRQNMGINGKQRVLSHMNSERMAVETLGYIVRELRHARLVDSLERGLNIARYMLPYVFSAMARRTFRLLKFHKS
jgi:phosphatidylinositol alpha-1,6-mannosyltransferase